MASFWSYCVLLVFYLHQAAQLDDYKQHPVVSNAVEFPPRITPGDGERSFLVGHMKPFGHQRNPDGPVAEYKDVLHPGEFWSKHVAPERPLVFRQAIKDSPAISKWTDSYLSDKYGDLDVLIELKRENRSHSAKRMNISTFLQRYKKEDVYVVTVLPNAMRHEIQVNMRCIITIIIIMNIIIIIIIIIIIYVIIRASYSLFGTRFDFWMSLAMNFRICSMYVQRFDGESI